MIGRTADSAIPTIVFFCEEKEPRKMAKKTVDEGGLLARLPRFRTGHYAKQPSVGRLIQPASADEAAREPYKPGSIPEVYFDPSHPIETIGMPIFVKQSGDVLRRATGNAVFNGSKWMIMSVAHVFVDRGSTVQDDPLDGGDDEYDFGSGTELEGDENFEATSRASVSQLDETSGDEAESTSHGSDSSTDIHEAPSTTYPLSQRLPSRTEIYNWLLSTGYRRKGSDVLGQSLVPISDELERLGYLSKLSTDRDWSLVEVENPEFEAMLSMCTTQPGTSQDHTRRQEWGDTMSIIVRTPHGIVSGSLSNISIHMRLPDSTKFREVFELSLDLPLDCGDCGSVVLDAVTAQPCGHVIASSETKTVAYIMPADHISTEAGTNWAMPQTLSSSKSVNKANTG
jgi:hypothetical protein